MPTSTSRALPVLVLVYVLSAACSRSEAPAQSAAPAATPGTPAASSPLPAPAVPLSSMPKVDPAVILQHIKVLSSDKFQGRAPGGDRRRPDGWLPGDAVQGSRPQAGQSRRHLRAEGPARRHHRRRRQAAHLHEGCGQADAQVERRGGRVVETRGGQRPDRQVGRRVRRLWHRSAGIRLERLQEHRRHGQDHRRPRQRSADSGSRRCVEARREDVRRQGDDLLRPLDLQVRRRGAQGSGRGADRPRDGAGGVSVLGRAGESRREVRHHRARQEHEPLEHRGMDHRRCRTKAVHDGGTGFRRR